MIEARAYQSGGAAPLPSFPLELPTFGAFMQARFCIVPAGCAQVTSAAAAGSGEIEAMRSLDEFAGEKLGELDRAQLRRAPVVTARAEFGPSGMPPFAVVFLQRLSQPVAASGVIARRWRQRRATASAPAPRASSPAITALWRARKPARAAKRQRSMLRIRLRLPRQCRHHPGARRSRRSDPDR